MPHKLSGCKTIDSLRKLPPMSVAELKHAVDDLTTDQRLELAEYLRWRSRKDDPEWQAELGRRLNRSLAGHGHSAAELQQLNDKLSAEGQ